MAFQFVARHIWNFVVMATVITTCIDNLLLKLKLKFVHLELLFGKANLRYHGVLRVVGEEIVKFG